MLVECLFGSTIILNFFNVNKIRSLGNDRNLLKWSRLKKESGSEGHECTQNFLLKIILSYFISQRLKHFQQLKIIRYMEKS